MPARPSIILLFLAVMEVAGCGGGGVSPQGMQLNPKVVSPGGAATLTWAFDSATSCQASGAWTGARSTSGNVQLAPTVAGIYTYSLTCTGQSGTALQSVTLGVTPAAGKIDHVVILVQENRTPDNLFHGLPGADIADAGVNSVGQVVPLQPVPLADSYDLDHSHNAFVSMYDGGKMDGADKIRVNCYTAGTPNCIPSNPQFKYVDPADVAPYFQLAERYAFADRMFQTNQGPSFPAHQFLISGTSAPSEGSLLFAAENPSNNAKDITGCMAPQDQLVALIDPLGNESAAQYPCFEHVTLIDLLDEAGVSWRYYTPSTGSIWTGPNAIRHLYMGPDWKNVVTKSPQVLNDIASGQLPQVTWVIPAGQQSDHPSPIATEGPQWIATVVNAIGNSPYWNSTAIFITWDDWGGWYDHVPPPIYDSYEYGFRVPLLVVSPYAKNAYVSHVTHDFGSMLKFIEEDFGLPSLGYADARSDDLIDCFDFSNAPAGYQNIAAKFDSAYFTSDSRTPADPDDE